MRYERKYRIEHLDFQQVLATIRHLPMGFHTAYPDRWVNSIYLDTPDLQALRDKLNGVSNRVKFRIRWYGEDAASVKSPVLESKIRVGDLGEKTSRPLHSFHIDSRYSILDYVKTHIPSPPVLEPVLINRYLRSYLISGAGDFRLTIDRELQSRSIAPGFFSDLNSAKDHAVIVEIKYHESLDDLWAGESREWPFKETRNSKYVTGMMMTGLGLE